MLHAMLITKKVVIWNDISPPMTDVLEVAMNGVNGCLEVDVDWDVCLSTAQARGTVLTVTGVLRILVETKTSVDPNSHRRKDHVHPPSVHMCQITPRQI